MLLYVLLAFSTLCLGMAISVYAFGTGGKRKKIFQDIYFSVEDVDNMGVLYTKTGEYSAVLRFENPVQKFSANIDSYYEFTRLFTSIAETLGEGYTLHKQDVFVKKRFEDESCDQHEYLSDSYFRYFKGREYTDAATYLTITQENRKSRLMSYDARKWRDFLVKVRKVQDQLRDAGVNARFLSGQEVSDFVDRFFAQDFRSRTISMTGFKVDDEQIFMGDRKTKVYSLIDVDCINLPSLIRPFTNIEVNNTSMPVDLLSLVDSIPGAESVVYNQMIFVPNQKRELSLLDKKKNRHASMPNPSNQIAVEDIKQVLEIIARESKQLVYAHYNLVVTVSRDTDLQKCTNHLENAFGRMGIHISKRAYNQLELFVNSFPGNCYATSEDYDRFLTLGDTAACLMYKEHIVHSEDTPFKVYYTDRQGVPVAIDISGKEGKEKLTDNSNFFVLGPSGSGKSTIVNWLMKEHPELKLAFSISCTSRAPRGTEKNGVEYFFLTPEEFKAKIEADEFLEYEEVYQDRFYGTLKSQVENQLNAGESVMFDVDVKGGVNIKKFYGERALSIFVQPPSVEELRRRLNGRGTDAPEVIEQRLAKASYELTFAPQFDHVVVNDDLEKAEQEVYELVRQFLSEK